MILVTGDTHGDYKRFKNKLIKKLKKGDSLIICGDFGFIWNGSKKEKRMLKKLGRKRYNILFAEGVHENYDELEKYEIEPWCGGLTRKIYGNLRQLIRGSIFDIQNKSVFVFGGGRSDENDTNLVGGKERWRYEIPTDEELEAAMNNLAEHDFSIDYIVTYEPPATLSEFLDIGTTDRSHINTYLEEIKRKTTFKMWFFGRHHINKLIPTKYQALFDDVVRM